MPLNLSARKSRADNIEMTLAPFFHAAGNGRVNRSMLGRKIALAIWPAVFETLDYEDDEIFLEPLIFSAGVAPEITVDLPELLRSGTSPRKLRCKPYFVPNIGYFDGDYNLVQSIRSSNGIEILLRGIQGLEKFCGIYTLPNILDETRIDQTLEYLRVTSPSIFKLLNNSCKRIIPIRNVQINSFANNAMPNTVFLNLSLGDSIAALVEDFVHQSMHCVFSDIEQSANPYTIPSEDLLKDHISAISGNRTISVLHHSCLTLVASCKALENLIAASELSDNDTMEAKARIGFLGRKMAIDLMTAYELDALNSEWKRVFWALVSKLQPNDVYDDWLYETQRYNFSFSAFCVENMKTREGTT